MQCSNIYNTSFGLQSECKGCGMIIFIFVSPGFTQNNYTKYYTIQKFPTIWYKDVYYNNVIIPFLTVDVKTFPMCLLVDNSGRRWGLQGLLCKLILKNCQTYHLRGE